MNNQLPQDHLAVASDNLNIPLRLVYADALEKAGDTEAAERQRKLAQAFAASPDLVRRLTEVADHYRQSAGTRPSRP